MDIIFALLLALAVVSPMSADVEVNDETTIEEEIIKLKHLLPSTKKLYMIDYSNNIITFVDNKGKVIELPFEKMFIEITQDKDKANILKLEYRVKKFPDGEIVEKECKKATIFQCDKEVDD